ncbi:DUF5916 domain-containing protein [Acidobacteriota bacterium]
MPISRSKSAKYIQKLTLLFFVLSLFVQLNAANDSKLKKDDPTLESLLKIRKCQAENLSESQIQIDGELNEEAWQRATALTDFIQNTPDEGASATEKTEVFILYSQDSLYIGVRAYDSEYDKIKSILARRDSKLPSDWINIWIDSYHDHRSAFQFSVNPAGVKRDIYWSDERKQDDDWDAVWDVEVSLDQEGWYAEFRIPFSQIRFPKKDTHTWGFQAARVIARKNETSYWGHIPKGTPQFVSLFGEIQGIRGIPSPKRLQFLPYSVAKGAYSPANEGNPFSTGSQYTFNMGLNIKYGLTSNLTLDGTFNPDFGQVEADPAQVNLTAYETYFPEKRPFFIEGKSLLDFKLGSELERDSLFYSRRIGRAPQGYPSSAQYYQKPENTTILSALKLTGKTESGWSIGFLEALTSNENASVRTWDGEDSEERVEPLTNYLLGRAEKEFREGRSAFGFILTAVNRKIDSDNLNFLRNTAFSGGLDFRHRWSEDRYEVKGFFIGSHIRGSEMAILSAQTSSARYFQRPDADHLELDPTKTSLSGFSGYFSLSKIGGGHWRWTLSNRTRSPGFEVNDMGYMRNTDTITSYLWIDYREYKPGNVFRDYDVSLLLNYSSNFAWDRTGSGASLRANFRLLNYWRMTSSLSRTLERLSTTQLRGGPALTMPGNWSISGSISTDSRRNFFLSLRGSYSLSDNKATTHSISSTLSIRPSNRLSISLSPSFSDGFRRLQYLTKRTIGNNTRYILSRIDQSVLSLTLRLNYAIAPNLSLQLYTQPYISAGDYNEFKEVIEPRATSYDNRWHIFSEQDTLFQNGYYYFLPPDLPGEQFIIGDPDFNFRQFRFNFVIRWEYLPGSTIFLVWTNGANDYGDVGRLDIGDDLKGLFRSPSNNAFLIKVSYWFNL